MPDPIADLDVEVQAMYERVRVRLGMRPGEVEMLGRYELRDAIGRGGMGVVYRGYDTELQRDVAIKVIAVHPGTNPQLLRRRLRREAQLLARLDHENLVTVYDSGSHGGRAYLVMEIVDGPTLLQLQRTKTLDIEAILRHYAAAGRGLLAAHMRGVCHRDFKPENVFVGADGRVRVGDFGLAHVFGEVTASAEKAVESDQRGLSHVGGTLGYTAPEQLRGESAEAAADQYAFCVALWEALGGKRPFAGANAQAMLGAMEGSPEGGERIDMRLRRALQIGLSLRPEDRHPSMAQLVAAIDEVLSRPKRRRRRATFASLGLATAVGVVGAVIGYRATHPECELAEAIATLQDETNWDRFEPSVARELERRMAVLRAQAERSCIRGDVSTRQHVESTLHSLRSLLAAEDWRDHIERFEADFASKASVPMTPVGYGFLAQEIQPLENQRALEQLVAKCDQIAPIVWPSPDRAGLLLPCARARGLVGDWDRAIADYERAREAAELVGDRTRRLQATLGAAKFTIIRLQNYDLGRGRLEPAQDLLRTLDVPFTDPRKSQFEELSSMLQRERGLALLDDARELADEDPETAEQHRADAQALLDDALSLLRLAAARQILAGAAGTRVQTLMNLANLHELRGELDWAEVIHRMAVHLDREDPLAAYNLGRFLANEDRGLDEARRRLTGVLSMRDHDLHLITTAVLLSMELAVGDSDAIAPLRTRLTEMLKDERIPRTPDHAAEAWLIVAASFACADDLGPGYREAVRHVPESLMGALEACKPPPQQPPNEGNENHDGPTPNQ